MPSIFKNLKIAIIYSVKPPLQKLLRKARLIRIKANPFKSNPTQSTLLCHMRASNIVEPVELSSIDCCCCTVVVCVAVVVGMSLVVGIASETAFAAAVAAV